MTRKEQAHRWYLAHRNEVIARVREWKRQHPEAEKKHLRAYVAKSFTQRKTYRQAHKTQHNARRAARRKANQVQQHARDRARYQRRTLDPVFMLKMRLLSAQAYSVYRRNPQWRRKQADKVWFRKYCQSTQQQGDTQWLRAAKQLLRVRRLLSANGASL